MRAQEEATQTPAQRGATSRNRGQPLRLASWGLATPCHPQLQREDPRGLALPAGWGGACPLARPDSGPQVTPAEHEHFGVHGRLLLAG